MNLHGLTPGGFNAQLKICWLSFREAPVILTSLNRLSRTPDLLMIDGHGITHPRRVSIAAHIGVMADLPALGVAKKRLCGRYQEPSPLKEQISPLYDGSDQIGTVLRSRDKVKPLFISPSHKISHETAIEMVKICLTRFRLPEPTRLADKLSKFQKDSARLL
ncbi:MAG: endonuclease V [Alphaproteobacteria bacterium]